MPQLKTLQSFALAETDEGYAMTVGVEGGPTLELAVSPDQLDEIIDALNQVLGADIDGIDIEGDNDQE